MWVQRADALYALGLLTVTAGMLALLFSVGIAWLWMGQYGAGALAIACALYWLWFMVVDP